MDWQPAFGQVLKSWRESRGLTQEELAKRVGRVRTTVNGWENGHHFPRKNDILAAIRIVGADPEEFFGEVGARWGGLLRGEQKVPAEPPAHTDPANTATDMLDAELDETTDKAGKLPQDEVRPELDVLVRALEDLVGRVITSARDRRR